MLDTVAKSVLATAGLPGLRRAARRESRAIALIAPWSLFAACIGFAVGCDTQQTPTYEQSEAGVAQINQNYEKLPEAEFDAKSALPASLGPAGSLFGLLLDDDSQVYVLGTGSGSTMDITGAVYTDSAGNLILRQDVRSEGTKLTFSSGDSIDVDAGGTNLKFVMTLAATDPPSVIVAEYDETTHHMSMDAGASSIEDTLASDYQGESTRIRIADPTAGLKRATWQSSGSDCAYVGDKLVYAVGMACGIKSMIVKAAPLFIINAMCSGAEMMLDTLEQEGVIGDEIGLRVAAALKVGITISCEGLKKAVDLGDLATKLNPLDAACTALSLANNGSALITGESLAQQICDIFATDSTGPSDGETWRVSFRNSSDAAVTFKLVGFSGEISSGPGGPSTDTITLQAGYMNRYLYFSGGEIDEETTIQAFVDGNLVHSVWCWMWTDQNPSGTDIRQMVSFTERDVFGGIDCYYYSWTAHLH